MSGATLTDDPYGEHDFGAVEVESHRCVRKIYYYDQHDSDSGAEKPDDAGRMERVLAIMLVEEY